jgi:hypothetical protein
VYESHGSTENCHLQAQISGNGEGWYNSERATKISKVRLQARRMPMFGGRLGVPELVIIAIILLVIIKTGRIGRFAFGGFILGGFVGFLLRPSVPVIGQLPFGAVITRGANLTGVDIVLRSTAEQSFNYMLIGAIIGAVLAAIVASRTPQHKKEETETKTKAASVAVSAEPAPRVTRFCTKCGAALGTENAFCGSCGARIP